MFVLGLVFIVIVFSLSLVIISKMEMVKKMQSLIDNLQRSLDEMDEQAKLVVRTDMELNKTQEELDKKVNSLYTLQNLSKSISTTLEESQIFKGIDAAFLKELGFEKGCLFLYLAEEKKFLLRLNTGYFEDEISLVNNFVNSAEPQFFIDLIRANKTISSHSKLEMVFKEKIYRFFKIHAFIFSALLPKEGGQGFLFVGTENTDTVINEGDEEIIALLTNQIGQALENARLFEKTWRAQQDLEKKVEERTHELKSALEEVNIISKRKSDFISAVSHELRTPLTSIKGYASILLTGKLGKLPEDMLLRLEKVNKHSDELVGLVNDLLDISRIESGKVTMKKEEYALREIVSGVFDLLSEQQKAKQIEFLSHIPDDANMVLVDLSQAKRVFINIIGNALKFTPEKGSISVFSKRAPPQQIQVDITDTGCGIPLDAQDKIFDEFYRVENAINQEVKGTGLGLALVKNIIEAHAGKIWLKSRPREGATFSFTLPAKI